MSGELVGIACQIILISLFNSLGPYRAGQGRRCTRYEMMRMLFVLSAIAATMLAAAAKAQNYPWCAIYKGGAMNCGFTTFQQCLATVSQAGFCIQNSTYQTSPEPHPPTRVRRNRYTY